MVYILLSLEEYILILKLFLLLWFISYIPFMGKCYEYSLNHLIFFFLVGGKNLQRFVISLLKKKKKRKVNVL